MEQVRNRVNIRLITDRKNYTKLSANHTTVHQITNSDLPVVMVHATRQKVYFNKPNAVGFCILSKFITYKFYYDYFKPS